MRISNPRNLSQSTPRSLRNSNTNPPRLEFHSAIPPISLNKSPYTNLPPLISSNAYPAPRVPHTESSTNSNSTFQTIQLTANRINHLDVKLHSDIHLPLIPRNRAIPIFTFSAQDQHHPSSHPLPSCQADPDLPVSSFPSDTPLPLCP